MPRANAVTCAGCGASYRGLIIYGGEPYCEACKPERDDDRDPLAGHIPRQGSGRYSGHQWERMSNGAKAAALEGHQ